MKGSFKSFQSFGNAKGLMIVTIDGETHLYIPLLWASF